MNITHAQEEGVILDENFNYITLNTTILKNDNNSLNSVKFVENQIDEETSHYILGYN
jgi:hypothetical protein